MEHDFHTCGFDLSKQSHFVMIVAVSYACQYGALLPTSLSFFARRMSLRQHQLNVLDGFDMYSDVDWL